MPDVLVFAGALLVAGPLIGAVCLFYPPLWRVWTVPREEHLALVAGHRLAWTMVNVGFTAATVLTAGGLVLLAGSVDVDARAKATLVAGAVAYAVAGTLWGAVLAIRTRTTPAIAALVAAGTPTEPVETMIGSVNGGLFASFTTMTGVALVVICATLALAGVVVAPLAWIAVLLAAIALAGFLAFGDMPPFVLYLPTLMVGAGLLLGWS
jgi:hypothetical protein